MNYKIERKGMIKTTHTAILTLSIILIALINSSFQSKIKTSEIIYQLNRTYTLREVPEKITSCKVKLADGKYIDLTSLDRASNPRFEEIIN